MKSRCVFLHGYETQTNSSEGSVKAGKICDQHCQRQGGARNTTIYLSGGRLLVLQPVPLTFRETHQNQGENNRLAQNM